MYAVIKTGGKQYKVAAGDKIRVEQIPADVGAEIRIDQVLAVGSGESLAFGAPLVDGASVSATVLTHARGEKVRIFKMRRRKHYQKRQGHRQNYTELFIAGITSAAGNSSADAGPALERARKRAAIHAAAVAGGKATSDAAAAPVVAVDAAAENTEA